jgi:hypothetical protein
MTREELRDKIWADLEPDLDAYGDLIDALIEAMPLEVLAEFVSEDDDGAYTFGVDDECPHCRADLTQPDSVMVNDGKYFVDAYGLIAEAEMTHLCLPTRAPDVRCAACNKPLDIEPEGEDE